MTQPETPVQAHPINAAATPPTNSNTGHEQPRPASSQTAPTAGLETNTELPPMRSVVTNVQGAAFDLPTPDAESCIHGNRILQPPHAHTERAGKPSRATRHASTTHGLIFPGRSGENSPGRRRRIPYIRRTTKTRNHALVQRRHTRNHHRGPSRPTTGQWS